MGARVHDTAASAVDAARDLQQASPLAGTVVMVAGIAYNKGVDTATEGGDKPMIGKFFYWLNILLGAILYLIGGAVTLFFLGYLVLGLVK